MSEGKFKQICQSLKFFDLHLCFPILDFYSKSQSFNNQQKNFTKSLYNSKKIYFLIVHNYLNNNKNSLKKIKVVYIR